ncbi:MAG TPA: hypothetical protein ENN11_05420 [Methanomicrobia archaeon]|nr:hypothetical protein [Methanomicrobia archaeon]
MAESSDTSTDMTTLRRKVILFFATAYPMPVTDTEILNFLSELDIDTTQPQLAQVLQELHRDGVITRDAEGAERWQMPQTEDVLEHIAKDMLENEDAQIFVQSPYVRPLLTKEFLNRHEQRFKESLTDLSPSVLAMFDVDGSAESIDELFSSLIEEMEQDDGSIAPHPELIYWMLYPDEMIEKIQHIHQIMGSECLDELLDKLDEEEQE